MKRLVQIPASYVLVLLLVLIVSCGCAPRWQLTINDAQGSRLIESSDWVAWRKAFPDDLKGRNAMALERVLATASGFPLEMLEVGGVTHVWRDVRSDAWLMRDGQICLLGDCLDVTELRMIPPANQPLASFEIAGLAPTIAGALGSPSPEETSGRALGTFKADQVLLVFVDGLSYERAMALRGTKTTPFLDTLGMPQPMLAVYPGQGAVPLAVALTGAPPLNNGIIDGNCRELQAETLLDVLVATGQGARLFDTHPETLDLNADLLVHLPGDEAQAFDLAAASIREDESALVVLRIASLDQQARAHGLQSAAYLKSLNSIDEQLARLVIDLPDGVMVLIASGYGLHAGQAADALPTGSSLSFDDMVVPLWVVQV